MSGANAITNSTISLSGAASMITGSNDITLTGSLVGTGGFTKAGSHTLALTGSSVYSGATAVQEGSLVLAGGNNRIVSAGGLTLGSATSVGRLVLGVLQCVRPCRLHRYNPRIPNPPKAAKRPKPRGFRGCAKWVWERPFFMDLG
jgi:autotransporter-associated beta strand protein